MRLTGNRFLTTATEGSERVWAVFVVDTRIVEIHAAATGRLATPIVDVAQMAFPGPRPDRGPLYFAKAAPRHAVNPIRAVTATKPDLRPRRHAARVICSHGAAR